MILKSYEIENNIKNILNYSYVLIYGENIGLKEVLKKKIIYLHNNSEIINIYNDDLTKNKDILFNEVSNNSLFAQKKLIIINQVNEQIVSQIETFLERNEESLGEIFCFFILETILLGKALNVNPFDQPSVELIKKETKKILLSN